MIKKLMAILGPVSALLFAVDSGVIALGVLLASVGVSTEWLGSWMNSVPAQWLSNFSPLINSLFVVYLGWLLTTKANKEAQIEDDNYNLRRLGVAMVAGSIFIPIVFAPTMLFPYIVGKAFIFRFVALTLFLVYLLLALSSSAYRPRITPSILGFGLLTLIMGLSTLFSIDPYKSFFGNYERMEGYITTILLFGFLVSLVGLRLKEVEWKKVFGIHVGVSMFVSGMAWLQYFAPAAFAGIPVLGQCAGKVACQADSTLGNPIYLGIYATLSAWIIAYALFSKKTTRYVSLLWIAFILNIGALIFSAGRGTFLGLVVGIFVASLTYLWVNNKKDLFAKFALLSVVVVALGAGLIWGANKYGFGQSIPLVAKFASTNTLFARFNVWGTGIDAWQAKPIFGWGQENFIHAFNKFYNPAMYGQETYFDHPHNTYLGWLAMGGILGFLAYISFVCASVWSIYQTYKKEEGEQASIGLAIALGAIVTYLIHIFFVFDNLTSIMLLMFMIAYFARGISFGSLALPQIANSNFKAVAVGATLVTFVFMYFSWWQPIYANKLIIQAMGGGKGETITQKVDYMKTSFDKAIGLGSFGTYEAVEQMANRGLSLGSMVSRVDAEAGKSIVKFNESAKANLEKQANSPFDHKAKFAYALYLSSLGDYTGAEKYMSEALALAPQKQLPMTYLAGIYAAKGDMDKALALYKQAVDVTPVPNTAAGLSAYNSLRIQYIQALMLAGKQKESVEVIKNLLPVSTRSDFQSLVAAMTDVYSAQKDLKGIIAVLVDAQSMDPQNTNFVIWLARALAYAGEYQASAQEIAKLQVIDPQFVSQFQQELVQLANQGKKQSAQSQAPAPTTSTATQATATAK